MRPELPVAIIGGGLAGLASAVTLAARGHRVVLFEANAWLGGKAAVLERDGWRFDMGPTILTLPRVLERVFAEAGRALHEELELLPLDPQWRCFFDDNSRLDLVADVDAMAARIDELAPGSSGGAATVTTSAFRNGCMASPSASSSGRASKACVIRSISAAT
jgi:phytoene dehydrogenase-like protein